jgi:hypothetical protein
VTILPSSGEQRLSEIKRGLVLDLYLGERAFWAEIKGAREHWSIKPEVRLPPARLPLPYPEGDSERAQEWANEMHSFRLAFFSDSWRFQHATDWDDFFGACVLYDPPELELARFAEYGGTKPEGGDRSMKGGRDEAEGKRMVAPPIRWLPTHGQVADWVGEFYDALIGEIGRRCVEPTGKRTTEAVNEILLETGLLEDYQSSFDLDEQRWDLRPYIALDDLPKDEDVVKALRLVRATRDKDTEGKPRRDELLAIKLAALKDEHNWSYERLVDEFDLDKADKARKVDKQDAGERKRRRRIGEEYVKLGRPFRSEHKANRHT